MPVTVRAIEHLDPDGSVVRSGVALAEATLKALDAEGQVEVRFDLKGASSSYFNVFLRRIEEGCGLAEINRHITLTFGSGVQRMVFDRSYASMKKGPREPSLPDPDHAETPDRPARLNFWRRLLGA